MPELPEVEITRRGIESFIVNQKIKEVVLRQQQLRWPVRSDLTKLLKNEVILSIRRRAKYLLLKTATGTLIIHLGMSGSLRTFTKDHIPDVRKHDHMDIEFNNGTILRFHDPRRFGAVLWFVGTVEWHPLLIKLGPEPLSNEFDDLYLQKKLAKQKRAIKVAIMDNKTVVGVGNIYANEALFRSSIHPATPAMNLTDCQYHTLAKMIKEVLQEAILAGGSTLRDFVNSDGKSGYFQLHHFVYGRAHEPCRICGQLIEKINLGQRSSFYCPICQK